VPAVIAIAAIAFIAWMTLGPEPRFAHALVSAVAVLIIACPCALGLSTPMSIMVGTGRGAQAGVLVKNAETLETMEKLDLLIVDKTGTLTEGKPQLITIEYRQLVPGSARGPGSQLNAEENLLRLAAALEKASEHPLAAAIVAASNQKNIALPNVDSF